MPIEDDSGKPGPDKLSLVLFSGNFDRVHYALTMASAALASNAQATLFFTMGAVRALLPVKNDRQGWHTLLPGENGKSAADSDTALRSAGLAGFEELLEACIALGGKIMVCEMGLKAMGLTLADLRGDIEIAPGGLVTFLADASRDGALTFV